MAKVDRAGVQRAQDGAPRDRLSARGYRRCADARKCRRRRRMENPTIIKNQVSADRCCQKLLPED